MSDYKLRLKRNISLFYLSSFFRGLIFIIPVWVAFERRFLNYEQMALLEAAGMAVTMFLELPTGALADLIGRRMTIVLGIFIRVAGGVMQAFSFNAFTLIFGFLFGSLGSTLISGTDEALVYDSLKEAGQEEKFQKVFGKNSLFFQSGIVIATLLGGYLYQFWIGLPYLAEAGAEAIALVMFFIMIEPRIDSLKFTLSSYIKQTKEGFLQLFQNPYIKRVSLFYILVGGITWSSQYFFNQPLATDLGFTEIEKSWLFSFIRFINAIVLFKLTNLNKFFSKKRAFLLFPILMIVSFLPGFWVGKMVGVFLLTGASFASTARFVILGQYTNEEFASRHRATAVSSLNLLVSLMFILIVVFSGRIMTLYSTKLIYTLLGLLSFILILPLGLSLAKNHHSLKQATLLNKL